MESHKDIEQHAALWLTRREEANWTAADEAQLNAWIESSTAHKIAFIRLQAGWHRAGRLKALGAGGEVGVVPPRGRWHTDVESESSQVVRDGALAHVRASRFIRLWAIAASLLVAVVVSTGAILLRSASSTYATPVGGTASVPMKDGSSIVLNTDSAVHVALSATQRQVRLDHGEAFFDVAQDPNRPFVVIAGEKRVIAVGTKFSVRRIQNDVRVFVTEGKVRIEEATVSGGDATSAGSAAKISNERAARPVLVAAGGIARASDENVLVQQNALPEIENYLSWRSGYLIFDDTPLADAVAEFNRYNDRKIVIADPQVAAIRIGGKFRSTNIDVFVRLLTQGYPIDAQTTDGQIVFRDRTPR